eukprot:GHUV01044922.1.p1 GENE.GHUV01044922.1~~GHUV01044922.1.p1  ORF type:complete len:112 (-),score=17.12 GHUV01044922.1:493-828(-)
MHMRCCCWFLLLGKGCVSSCMPLPLPWQLLCASTAAGVFYSSYSCMSHVVHSDAQIRIFHDAEVGVIFASKLKIRRPTKQCLITKQQPQPSEEVNRPEYGRDVVGLQPVVS